MRLEPDMGDEIPEGDAALPANLRFLRVLVTVLTAVMILGVITIVGLLVIRLNDGGGAAVLVVPSEFDPPAGVAIVGYSLVEGRTVLIGDDAVIRVYDTDSRALVQEIRIGAE